MCIISKSLVNNGYHPFAHNLRLECAKNAGFYSKHSFCNTFFGMVPLTQYISQSTVVLCI